MKHIAKSLIVAALAALTSPSVLAATPALGIADDTLESVSFADGFSGLVAEWLADMYRGVKAQILEWDADSGRFAVAGEQANEDEWPNFQFSVDASAGPVTLQVANDLPLGSEMLFWDESAQTWNGGTKTVRGWPSAQAYHVIAPGEGFFVQSPTAGTWVAARPYASAVPPASGGGQP